MGGKGWKGGLVKGHPEHGSTRGISRQSTRIVSCAQVAGMETLGNLDI